VNRFYWNYTDCISSDNLEAIELVLTGILEQEGCRRISLPPKSPPELKEIKQQIYRPWETVPELWIIGLFVGVSGWTIVKTVPTELLCRRAQGATCSRLSELAMQIGCGAFHLSVYGSTQGILMEVDARGRIFICGQVDPSGPKDGKFHDEQINQQESPRQFFLLNVPEEMQAAMRVETKSKELRRRREELKQLYKKGESEPFDSQAELEELSKGRFQLVDEALEPLVGGFHSYWHLTENMIYENQVYKSRVNLVHLAYTQQQQLEADGVRLLYFQPSEHYRQPDPGERRGATSNSVPAAIEYYTDFPFGASET
jgi:hypothetical protein